MNYNQYDRVFSSGRPVVGYLCTATPPEIIDACGGLPVRLMGDATNLETAEALAHPNLCGFCKSALAWAAGIPEGNQIITISAASCDGCRRSGALFETLPAVKANFGLDLPRQGEERDVAYFASQLRRLHENLAEALCTEADPVRLAESIGRYRLAREAYRRVLDAAYAGRLSIESAFEIADAYFASSADDFATIAEGMLSKAKDESSKIRGPKLLLAGNMTFGPEVAQALNEAGGHVVGLDLCNVERGAYLDVPDESDPYLALAKAVYARSLCPRFEPGDEWVDHLADRAKEAGAAGVVLFSLKFCDNTLFAFPPARKILEEQGLSVLTLEGEFASGLSGQLSTRIEAFIEMF